MDGDASRYPPPHLRGLRRRDFLRLGAGAVGAALLGRPLGAGRALADGGPPPSPTFTPFRVPLPLPPDLKPITPGGSSYLVNLRAATTQIIEHLDTEIWGYDGLFPGPTIRSTANQPIEVRFHNDLPAEASVHYHSGHTEAASDGHPALTFAPGEDRIYSYALGDPGGDPNDRTTTGWYHDHALDITGPNVYQGLAGFFLTTDQVEQDHIAFSRLPGPDFDVPLVIQDRRILADGRLFYSPFQHDGFLGDVYVANGKAQPFFKVQRRKYRFRVLNGCNARFLELRLSSGRFLQVGIDGWLLPAAVAQDTVLFSPARRADLIVDFRNAPSEVYLENILVQDEGRGPKGTIASHDTQVPGVPLVKFLVSGPTLPDDATLAPGDLVRPNTPIDAGEIAATRTFEFVRSEGAWQINGRFFDPDRLDATPALGSAERWILKNGGGGWWHPIHIHLEAHQVQRFNGVKVARPFKQDTTILGPGDVAEVFMRFRDFSGRFVFHCHNIEHEDMRMMANMGVGGR
jgi:FtsP/CotA-like multicopper oxidase with cupredoxin domain